MNCKPNDLAVIVRGIKRLGAIVRVTKLDPVKAPCGRPCWLYEGYVECVGLPGQRYESLWDHILRPIRDADGQDETLTWKAVAQPSFEWSPKSQREFT